MNPKLRWWCLDRATGRIIAYSYGPAPICTVPHFEMVQTLDTEPVPHPESDKPTPKAEAWKPLSDEQVDAVFDSLPGGAMGWVKKWGYKQFASAIDSKLREQNEPLEKGGSE